jgi:tRNA A37 threonylcarbamoyladenosine synthetase subunit TsaC/SUA5/YrdC
MDKDWVYLVQTDTTVGFASKDYKKLNRIKNRSEETKTLLTLASFQDLKEETRVPKKFRKTVRRSAKATFIYPNNAYRVVTKECSYTDLLKRVGGLYSTSANETGRSFDLHWAEEKADVVVYEKEGFREDMASDIYKLGRKKIKKIR